MANEAAEKVLEILEDFKASLRMLNENIKRLEEAVHAATYQPDEAMAGAMEADRIRRMQHHGKSSQWTDLWD